MSKIWLEILSNSYTLAVPANTISYYVYIQRYTSQVKNFENDQRLHISCSSKRNVLQYEGCPSKSWTFVISLDCIPGIL